jgi:hypothetical protein
MAVIVQGIGLRWGADATCTAFATSYSVQKYSVNSKGEKKLLKNNNGETVSWVGYDPVREITTDFVFTSATATASASCNPPVFGQKITISCPSGADNSVTGSNWIVEDITVSADNDGWTNCTLKACAYPLIT